MKHMIRRVLAILCSLCLVVGCVPALTEEQLSDVADVETIFSSDIDAVFAEEEYYISGEEESLKDKEYVMAEESAIDDDVAETSKDQVDVFLLGDGQILYEGNGIQITASQDAETDIPLDEPVGVPDTAKMVMAGTESNISDFVVESGILTSYTGKDQNIVIPESLGILTIGDNVFKDNTRVSSVFVPEGVMKIGNSSFAGMTGLQRIALPDSLLTIGESAFMGCTGLQSIIIPGNVTELQNKSFYNCNALRSVVIDGNSLLSIKDEAFSGCESLSTINLPDSLQIIGQCAFVNTKRLTSIAFGTSLLEINYSAFDTSGLVTVSFSNNLAVLEEEAFCDCDSLLSVSIPGSVAMIGKGAFKNCDSLKSVEIKYGVINIGDEAFQNCESLLKVSLPNSVESIGIRAFMNDPITEINWPASLTTIEESSFEDCSGIPTVAGSGLQYIGTKAFSGCSGMTSADLSAVKTIEQSAFIGASVLSTVNLTSNLENLGREAFRESGLTKLTIPGSVGTVPEDLCTNCDRLESVEIMRGVNAIEGAAFHSCDMLKNVSLPDSLTIIEQQEIDKGCDGKEYWGAFSSCPALSSIMIPESVTEIQGLAFSDCTFLRKIYIPRSVTVIADNVFEGCDYVTGYVHANSKAQEYFAGKNIKYVIVKDGDSNPFKIELSRGRIIVKNQVYTGKALKPAVKVMVDGVTLKQGTDYTVSYKNNKAIGKATVVVKGKDEYTDTVKKTFNINPKAVRGLKLKAGSKQITVTWKKDKTVTGYEIQYALNKKLKGAKKVTIKKAATVKTVIKKLKAKKTYYVRIRAYKTVKKVKYVSAWSKILKVTTKK